MARKKTDILAEMCTRPRLDAVNAAHVARREANGLEARGARVHDEIMHNQRIKEYPVGVLEVLTASRPVFREPGYEPMGKWASEGRTRPERAKGGEAADEAQPEGRKAENVQRAVRRAKQNLRDLALCNEMKYFITLTLNGEQIDRHDMAAITRKVNAWCSNRVQRDGLAYILVPERHTPKEGETIGAIHFHGFVNDAVEVVDSGTISLPGCKKPKRPRSKAQRAEWLAQGGQVVYNLPEWTLGFTTAIELYGDPVRAVNYCCKYIGKAQEGEVPERIGGRWFYHGGCHERPKVTYADVDFDRMEITSQNVWAFEVPAARAVFIKETINE